jgi:hypothetical protein
MGTDMASLPFSGLCSGGHNKSFLHAWWISAINHIMTATYCNACDLQVAEALMSASVPPGSCMARIMLFTGGPGTEGAGKVIGQDLTEEIRR